MRLYNLNGETPNSVYDSCVKALKSLTTAEEAFNALRPHPRDYQPDPGKFAEDFEEFAAMADALYSVKRYTESVALHAVNSPGWRS